MTRKRVATHSDDNYTPNISIMIMLINNQDPRIHAANNQALLFAVIHHPAAAEAAIPTVPSQGAVSLYRLPTAKENHIIHIYNPIITIPQRSTVCGFLNWVCK